AQPGDGQRGQRQRPVEAEAQLAPADGLDDLHGWASCGGAAAGGAAAGGAAAGGAAAGAGAFSIWFAFTASAGLGAGARRRSSPMRGASRSAGATVSKYLSTISIASGAATSPPWPPCSTSTASAILGRPAGAKPTNQACVFASYPPCATPLWTCAVPVLP